MSKQYKLDSKIPDVYKGFPVVAVNDAFIEYESIVLTYGYLYSR